MLHTLLLFTLLLLSACASPPTFQAVSQRLPSDGTRVVVYEVDSRKGGPAENEAVGWLLAKGLTVIERGSIERIIEEQRFSLMHSSESSVLRAGHLLGATEAVFITSGLSDVYLKGIAIESGRVLWTSSGKYPYACLQLSSMWHSGGRVYCHTHDLVRPALDAVWKEGPREGLRIHGKMD